MEPSHQGGAFPLVQGPSKPFPPFFLQCFLRFVVIFSPAVIIRALVFVVQPEGYLRSLSPAMLMPIPPLYCSCRSKLSSWQSRMGDCPALVSHPQMPFSVRVYVAPFSPTKPGEHPRKGYPSTDYQRSRRSFRELCGVTADPSRAGGSTLSPAGSRLLVDTPSQRDPAAAHEERDVVIFVGSVSKKIWE